MISTRIVGRRPRGSAPPRRRRSRRRPGRRGRRRRGRTGPVRRAGCGHAVLFAAARRVPAAPQRLALQQRRTDLREEGGRDVGVALVARVQAVVPADEVGPVGHRLARLDHQRTVPGGRVRSTSLSPGWSPRPSSTCTASGDSRPAGTRGAGRSRPSPRRRRPGRRPRPRPARRRRPARGEDGVGRGRRARRALRCEGAGAQDGDEDVVAPTVSVTRRTGGGPVWRPAARAGPGAGSRAPSRSSRR